MISLERLLRGVRMDRRPWGNAELEAEVLRAQGLELLEVVHAVACLEREGRACRCAGGPALTLTAKGERYLEDADAMRARASAADVRW